MATEVRATPMQPTTVRWRIFVLLLVMAVINLIDRTALSVGMPVISKEFALAPAVQGVILSAFFWSYAPIQIPVGWILDRLGARVVVAAAAVLWGAFQGLAAAATSGTYLLLTRIGLGIAEAPLFPAGGKLNANWLSPKERGRGAVIMDSGGTLGAAFGGIIIASLIAFFQSWRLAFLTVGVGTVIMGGVAYWYVRDNPEQHPAVNQAEMDHILAGRREAGRAPGVTPGDAPGADSVRTPYLVSRSFWGVVLGRIGWAMVFWGLVTWGPNYLAQARHLNLMAMGRATFYIFLAGAVGELVGGFLADRLQGAGLSRNIALKSLLGLSGVITFVSIFLLPSIQSAGAAVGLLSVTLFFLAWGGLYWSFPAVLAPAAEAGTLGGYMNFAGTGSAILVPLLAGFILQVAGSYDRVLYFFASCATLYFVGSLMINFERGVKMKG